MTPVMSVGRTSPELGHTTFAEAAERVPFLRALPARDRERLCPYAQCRRAARNEGLPLQLSRQDLADLCGTTIETAIRVMTRLGREGVVRAAARGLVIVDRPRLEEIARGQRCR